MYEQRKELYKELAEIRKSAVLAYVTGDRPNLASKIGADAVDVFGELLDFYEGSEKISLFLYTRGGDTLAAWSIVNLLREFCKKLEIIIPTKCHSAGTLMCLGADNIVMTKQSTLGPIDPSINTPLNPQIPGAPPAVRLPVSVEDVAGFIQMAKEAADIKDQQFLSKVFDRLSDTVNPVALGRIQRARSQIKDLANKLLKMHMDDKDKIENIIKVLCVEAGSHDYMIYRTEARNSLKLNIETPSMDLYKLLRKIYESVKNELSLDVSFDPPTILGNENEKTYNIPIAIIESQENGAYHYVKKGEMKKIQAPDGRVAIEDLMTFQGWEYKE